MLLRSLQLFSFSSALELLVPNAVYRSGCSGSDNCSGRNSILGWSLISQPGMLQDLRGCEYRNVWNASLIPVVIYRYDGRLSKVLRPTWHKIGNFGNVLPSRSLGLVRKKLNLTQQEQTQEQNGKKHTQSKPKENRNQQPALGTALVCVRITVHNFYHTQHSTEHFW